MPKGQRAKAGDISDLQKKFCLEYLKDFNATQAAIRAGYAKRSAAVHASRMLSNANIQAFIQKKAKNIEEKAEIDIAKVLQEFGRIAFSDMRKYFNDDGSMKDIHSLDDNSAAAISAVEVLEEFSGTGEKRKLIGYTKKLKLWDKKGSLDSIGKYLGMFKEIMEHQGKNGGPIQTETKHTVVFKDMSNESSRG